MTNKMTNRKALAYVLENMPDMPEDVRERLEAMATSLDNKSSAARKPTAKQQENDVLRERIMDLLRANPVRLFTCAEIRKEVDELATYENQKVSALMRLPVENGLVTKIKDKNKTFFQLAPKPQEDEEGGE